MSPVPTHSPVRWRYSVLHHWRGHCISSELDCLCVCVYMSRGGRWGRLCVHRHRRGNCVSSVPGAPVAVAPLAGALAAGAPVAGALAAGAPVAGAQVMLDLKGHSLVHALSHFINLTCSLNFVNLSCCLKCVQQSNTLRDTNFSALCKGLNRMNTDQMDETEDDTFLRDQSTMKVGRPQNRLYPGTAPCCRGKVGSGGLQL
jgi:hypothetical protein